jgi:hypothetical protein
MPKYVASSGMAKTAVEAPPEFPGVLKAMLLLFPFFFVAFHAAACLVAYKFFFFYSPAAFFVGFAKQQPAHNPYNGACKYYQQQKKKNFGKSYLSHSEVFFVLPNVVFLYVLRNCAGIILQWQQPDVRLIRGN